VNLLPPRVLGPLSECSQAVIVANVVAGAMVTLFVTRSGVVRRVGKAVINTSKGTVAIDSSQQLVAGDLVNASQALARDPESPRSQDGPQVQISIAQFDAAQVLSNLYRCSRGFFLGGMRPGITVQVLQSGSIIGTGNAIDGTAAMRIPAGLPAPGVALSARQWICPKPAVPPPSTGYIFDSALPPITALPFASGQTMPAPTIAQGLTACSRAVQVTGVQPGAEVLLEAVSGAWSAIIGPSDQVTSWLVLPTQLREGEDVSIRHDVSPHCQLNFEPKVVKVGPKQALNRPRMGQINCNTTPSIYVIDLKPETDIEFSVSVAGIETIYRTSASDGKDSLPAPPMPVGASVKVRQGECEIWSDWSDPPETANALTVQPSQPSIPGELFGCQDAVPVENVYPYNGYLVVMSARHGELNRVSALPSMPPIPVAPSLSFPDDIWIEHHVCGFVATSEAKSTRQRSDVVPGTIQAPLFDGDTTVLLTHAVGGAHIELWEETKNRILETGRAPFGMTEFVDVTFGGFGPLRAGWKIFAKTSHCGSFVQTASIQVVSKAPVITSIVPAALIAGHSAFTLVVKGTDFLTGAKVQWGTADRSTTFVSSAELHVNILSTDLTTAKTTPIRVINADGQVSGAVNFTVSPIPAPVVGFDELLIQNCNANTLPGSSIHRPIHIYFRRTDMGPPGPWIPISDSPHDADYDTAGHCPINSSVGAKFSLDDGATYEVVCTDPLLAGCMTGGPDEAACRRSSVFTVHGKAGGGVKTVIVN
jgi:hypothetical protein